MVYGKSSNHFLVALIEGLSLQFHYSEKADIYLQILQQFLISHLES